MPVSVQQRARLRGWTSAAVVGVLCATAFLGDAASAAPQSAEPRPSPTRSVEAGGVDGSYLVLLRGLPNVGGGPGDARLRKEQLRVATAVQAEPFYHYTRAVNGFAARMGKSQVAELRRRTEVLAVVADIRRPLAGVQPEARRGGQLSAHAATPAASRSAHRWQAMDGRGVVIGFVDSGLDSHHPMLDRKQAALRRPFAGPCSTGDETTRSAAFDCNGKVVGARYFLAGQGGRGAVWAGEHLSPTDRDGHGTQAALIAAADEGGRATSTGMDLGAVSGVASAAGIAAYKACWRSADDRASCMTSDTVAAIDRALGDGVDVLHVPVSNPTSNAVDAVGLATMYAAAAGVFVAAPAGNEGPSPGSVQHGAPWVTTVAAVDTAARSGELVLGDGRRFVGAAASAAHLGPADLLLGSDAAAAGGRSAAKAAGLCLPGSLDARTVDKAIVVCDRGRSARTEKSRVVANAGGVGMVLANRQRSRLRFDLHRVPTVHLAAGASRRVSAYVKRAPRPTARIIGGAGPGVRPRAVPAGTERARLATFSGRGSVADLLKPDLSAPGVDLVTATDPRSVGRAGSLASGTSMSSAAVAGHAALLAQRQPGWSPMRIKSALMTTSARLDGGRVPLGAGAGVISSRRVADPGLVLDSGLGDWTALLAGRGHRVLAPRTFGSADGTEAVRPSELNVASLAIDELAGREVVTRTFTNVHTEASTYSLAPEGLAGLTITAEPAVFTVAPGESQQVVLRISTDGAPLGRPVTGGLVLSDGSGGHVVRLPVIVRPIGLRTVDEISLDRGQAAVTVRAGVTNIVRPLMRGLVEAVDTAATGVDTVQVDFDPALPGNWTQPLEVDDGADLVRVQTIASDPRDDLDLYLVDADGRVVGSAATSASDETLTLSGLPPGTYTVQVQPWFVRAGSGETDFTVRTFVVPGRSAQQSAISAAAPLSISPQAEAVQAHRTYRWQIRSKGLDPDASYLGQIAWRQRGSPERRLASTVVVAD